MKRLFLILSLLWFSASAIATDLTGKYQIEFENGFSGLRGIFVFLLNSDDEIKIIEENSDYYIQSLEVNSFFGTKDFEIEWGSDEEKHYFSFTLSSLNGDPVITKFCSLYVDGPNGYHEFEELSLTLKKWNTEQKKFEEISIIQTDEEFLNCQSELGKRHL